MPTGRFAPDLTGQQFGALTVVRRNGYHRRGWAMWECRCVCGSTVNKGTGQLHQAVKEGRAISCGCLANKGHTTHGLSHDHAYNVWRLMMHRCYNDHSPQWHNYGGRGISVCERWQDPTNFIADMGEPPAGMSIDRIDVNGDYSPSNCRWATQREQCCNKRTNVYATIDGRRQCISQWAREWGVSAYAAKKRIAFIAAHATP